jgi:hypothetical protein
MQRLTWLAAALAGAACGAAAPVGWTAYADCAGAYRANAQVADSQRPASMTAQISEVAADYAAEAVKRWRRQAHGAQAAGRRAVETRAAQRAKVLGAQPREAVEHVIETCPQIGG